MSKLSPTVFAASILLASGISCAQSYPTKPIRLIVPFAPGGGPDIAARAVANELGKQLGQQVVVDNRPGASGVIGYEAIARAAPDGYTVGFVASIFTANPSMFMKLPYHSLRDFQPVIHATFTMSLLAATPSLPVSSLKELLDLARAKPGALSYGNGGSGSPTYLSMELLKYLTHTNILPVAYKGTPQAISDVIGGQIHLVCDSLTATLPHFKSGRVKALGVTARKRADAAPEVPTFNEAGIPGYEFTTLGGYTVPAGVPRDIVLRLNAEINRVLLLPSFSKASVDRGSMPVGGTPEQFAEHLRNEMDKLANVIKAAGIKPQ